MLCQSFTSILSADCLTHPVQSIKIAPVIVRLRLVLKSTALMEKLRIEELDWVRIDVKAQWQSCDSQSEQTEDVSPCTPKDYIGSAAQSELEGGYVRNTEWLYVPCCCQDPKTSHVLGIWELMQLSWGFTTPFHITVSFWFGLTNNNVWY